MIENEPLIRISVFIAVFVVMASWEVLAPRRKLTLSKARRWANNIALVVFNSLLLRLVFPLAAVGVAAFAQLQGWGILNLYDLSPVLMVIVAVVVMDFCIYLQHVMVHALPILWRLHRVHHADLDFDVTTGSRFHPLEIVLSMLIKFAVIVLLGAPVLAVILFEVLLSACALFNHANARLPIALDRGLRWLLVTPDMHRVHHSVEDDETNSNFGFCLPWWDRLFGTYRDQPRAGHTNMTLGIHGQRDPQRVIGLPGMLMLPFIGKINGYTLNRRLWADPHSHEADSATQTIDNEKTDE